jgi:hypothetical protein
VDAVFVVSIDLGSNFLSDAIRHEAKINIMNFLVNEHNWDADRIDISEDASKKQILVTIQLMEKNKPKEEETGKGDNGWIRASFPSKNIQLVPNQGVARVIKFHPSV